MEQSKKQTIAQKFSSYICPSILGSLICFSVVYTLYQPLALLYSVIFLAAEFLLFPLFDKLQKKKTFGGILYIGMLFAVGFLSMYLMVDSARESDIFVLSWFYGDEGSNTYISGYLNSVFLFGGFFVISILYYFTQIRYRSLGVMLSILFPFVIYAKRAEEIPEVLVTLIITFYLAVMVHNRRIDPAMPEENKGRLVVNRAYLISIALFVSFTGAVTMMLDKPVYKSQLEKNSNYFDVVQTNATGAGNYEGMSNTSSARYGANGYNNTPLFNFSTNGKQDIYYLRREAYDVFDGDVWEISADESFYGRIYSADNPEYSNDDIIADMMVLEADGILKPGSVSPKLNMLMRAEGRVYDDNFNPTYLPAPFGVISDELPYQDIITSTRSKIKYPHGEVYRSMTRANRPVIDDSFEFMEQTNDLKVYAASFGKDGPSLFNEITSNFQSESAVRVAADYTIASEKFTSQENISDKLKKLAEDITKDCKNDYEKAYALEQYFENNDYIYDLEYIPDDRSIDYFVFDSKTGVCSSYATAMTLMARAVGLPARYVEGFAAFERLDDGSFLIRDSYAHAFVEVYVLGVGWMTFDPTVSGYMQIPEENNFDGGLFVRVLGRLLVFIAVSFVIIFIILLDRIAELIFRIRLHFKSADKKVLMLYANVIKLVSFSAQEDYSPYTVKMIRTYLEESRGTAPYQLLELFEKTCFGGYIPSEEEFGSAYSEYKKCYRYLRKIPKKPVSAAES